MTNGDSRFRVIAIMDPRMMILTNLPDAKVCQTFG